ncbi:hypothetical protein THASP1DRAFT_32600 [Thamnocephalis sphaerospora]|uniref:Uncharacterized protein n=1 Tax=Thamnocephalis sphaerospora TaxID=78915 RepID=A0A4P9XIM4_9FUNG|nr:hypothetical protein THASP1DRAFT_32600 [Thamnocephalis sphaerospora]|eukprot:RKP05563.1 hypothetical protein THASP1DRAFT_32600 [Thamnocephalis sphaerospora]
MPGNIFKSIGKLAGASATLKSIGTNIFSTLKRIAKNPVTRKVAGSAGKIVLAGGTGLLGTGVLANPNQEPAASNNNIAQGSAAPKTDQPAEDPHLAPQTVAQQKPVNTAAQPTVDDAVAPQATTHTATQQPAAEAEPGATPDTVAPMVVQSQDIVA